MTDWIKENQVPHQIKYAVHTGDIIDQYQEKDQWKTAHKALKSLIIHRFLTVFSPEIMMLVILELTMRNLPITLAINDLSIRRNLQDQIKITEIILTLSQLETETYSCFI